MVSPTHGPALMLPASIQPPSLRSPIHKMVRGLCCPWLGALRQGDSHRHGEQELSWEPSEGLCKRSVTNSRQAQEYLIFWVTPRIFLTRVTCGRNTAGLSAAKRLVLKWKNKGVCVCFLFFSHKEPKKLPVVHTSQSSELVVTYFLCGEEIPYRRMLKAQSLTLGHFKEQLSKKGNYR